MKKKEESAINELEKALKKDSSFYSNIDTIRILIRAVAFFIITASLYIFNILEFDEAIFVLAGLALIEYIRYMKIKRD